MLSCEELTVKGARDPQVHTSLNYYNFYCCYWSHLYECIHFWKASVWLIQLWAWIKVEIIDFYENHNKMTNVFGQANSKYILNKNVSSSFESLTNYLGTVLFISYVRFIDQIR